MKSGWLILKVTELHDAALVSLHEDSVVMECPACKSLERAVVAEMLRRCFIDDEGNLTKEGRAIYEEVKEMNREN